MEELILKKEALYSLMTSFFSSGCDFSIKLEAPGFSMSPFIRPNSILTLRPFTASKRPRLGDIVTVAVHHHKKIIIHRIIAVKHPEYLVKGDNNLAGDGWFHQKDILGRVEKIKTREKEYTPGYWQGLLIGTASKTGILNRFILPAGRRLKHLLN